MTSATVVELAKGSPALVFALLVWMEVRTMRESLADVAASLAVMVDRGEAR